MRPSIVIRRPTAADEAELVAKARSSRAIAGGRWRDHERWAIVAS